MSIVSSINQKVQDLRGLPKLPSDLLPSTSPPRAQEQAKAYAMRLRNLSAGQRLYSDNPLWFAQNRDHAPAVEEAFAKQIGELVDKLMELNVDAGVIAQIQTDAANAVASDTGRRRARHGTVTQSGGFVERVLGKEYKREYDAEHPSVSVRFKEANNWRKAGAIASGATVFAGAVWFGKELLFGHKEVDPETQKVVTRRNIPALFASLGISIVAAFGFVKSLETRENGSSGPVRS